ncbi:MAG: hypothetical protein D9V47_14705 [Clostridia bacterium]|nr:MAG: hypothetical protein D9V47_14705 [Clostridia bacterium]
MAVELTAVQKARKVQFANRRWFDDHLDELIAKYPGQVIAVHGDNVVAISSSNALRPEVQYQEVVKQLEGKHDLDEVMITMVNREPVWNVWFPKKAQ